MTQIKSARHRPVHAPDGALCYSDTVFLFLPYGRIT
jgi:hypothetical protein